MINSPNWHLLSRNSAIYYLLFIKPYGRSQPKWNTRGWGANENKFYFQVQKSCDRLSCFSCFAFESYLYLVSENGVFYHIMALC